MSATDKEPMRIRCVAEWDTRPWSTDKVWAADINSDGRKELIFLQSSGAYAGANWDPRSGIESWLKTHPDDQTLFCITATDLEGKILWQQGDPWWNEMPFFSNGGSNAPAVFTDLDGDGHIEMIVVHYGFIFLLDAATGCFRRMVRLPDDGFYQVLPLKLDDSGRMYLFTKNCTGVDPGDNAQYGNPYLVPKLGDSWKTGSIYRDVN